MESFLDTLRELIESWGLDAGYVSNIVAILISFIFIDDIQNWNKLDKWYKQVIRNVIISAVGLTIFSALRLCGFLKF